MEPNSTTPRVLAVVPARFASQRFPGKIIANLAGKPLVLHAYERAREANLVTEALIATDHDEVVRTLRPFDAKVVMTRDDHACGTDRIAEVAEKSDADIIVNVQGDEALIDPATIDRTIRALLDNPSVPMATARHRITDPEQIRDPNVVKVVCDRRNYALYFSRSPIPFIRDWSDRAANLQCYWQHIGLYVFRREFLLEFAKMPQSPLERIEKLEQLRVIEAGIPIVVVDTEYESIGVDTPEDLRHVADLLKHHK